MKRLLPIITIIVALSLIIVNGDANVKVQMNETILSFKTAPVLVKNELMVPMREFFEALGTQVTWYPQGKVIAAYKNNMYVKLTVNSFIAYRNGKKVTLPVAPYVTNGRTLIPAKFIADTFDLTFKKIGTNQFQFIPNSSSLEYYLYSGNFYKKIESTLYGISYHIPSYWNALNEKAEIYGIKDEYEQFEVRSFYADKTFVSAESYMAALKADYKKRYTNVSILEENDYPTRNFSFKWLKASVGSGRSQKYFMTYVTVYKDKAYILEGTYYNRLYTDDFKEIMQNMASGFAISNSSVQIADEHYIEYSPMYDYSLRIKEETYSNMDINGRSFLSGTIKSGISNIIVSVSKNSTQLEFFLPVKTSSNIYEGYFYLPFGLGKHDITIYLQQSKDNKRLKAIQFSVINTNSKKLRYLIPTKYVEKDNSELNGLANLKTFRLAGDYQKALTLMEWMVNTIILESKSSVDTIRTAYEVYVAQLGTAREYCFLYAALLRTIDIPTRIYMGITNENQIQYWIESEINGKWVIIDPVAAYELQTALYLGQIKTFKQPYDLVREDFYSNLKTSAPLND